MYRVRNRFILKDILNLEGTITKVVPRAGVLAGNFIVYVNSEDGTSSKYKFRVRLSKYLQPSPNTTEPANYSNQTNLTGLPDLVISDTAFWLHPGDQRIQVGSSVPAGAQVYKIYRVKNGPKQGDYIEFMNPWKS